MPKKAARSVAASPLKSTHRVSRRNKEYKALRKWVWERDGHCCKHCGKPVDFSHFDLDHIIPVSQLTSGVNLYIPANLRVLCRTCHLLRADPSHQHMRDVIMKSRSPRKRAQLPANWKELLWEEPC